MQRPTGRWKTRGFNTNYRTMGYTVILRRFRRKRQHWRHTCRRTQGSIQNMHTHPLPHFLSVSLYHIHTHTHTHKHTHTEHTHTHSYIHTHINSLFHTPHKHTTEGTGDRSQTIQFSAQNQIRVHTLGILIHPCTYEHAHTTRIQYTTHITYTHPDTPHTHRQECLLADTHT